MTGEVENLNSVLPETYRKIDDFSGRDAEFDLNTKAGQEAYVAELMDITTVGAYIEAAEVMGRALEAEDWETVLELLSVMSQSTAVTIDNLTKYLAAYKTEVALAYAAKVLARRGK